MWVVLRKCLSAGGETRVVVDGVAYAPHLPIDVKGWGVDWYGFSVYKTWGPHMAALYGSHAAFQDLKVTPPPPLLFCFLFFLLLWHLSLSPTYCSFVLYSLSGLHFICLPALPAGNQIHYLKSHW